MNLIMRKTTKAMMRKLTVFWMKLPYFRVAPFSPPKKLGIVTERVVKLKPPPMRLTIGMMMSLTTEFTMAVKAEPITTPTARSMTLPRLMNSVNSFLKEPPLVFNFLRFFLTSWEFFIGFLV